MNVRLRVYVWQFMSLDMLGLYREKCICWYTEFEKTERLLMPVNATWQGSAFLDREYVSEI